MDTELKDVVNYKLALNGKKHLMNNYIGQYINIEWKGKVLGIAEMKRHYTNYFKGIPHFKDYRIKMVTSNCENEIELLRG